MRKVFVAALALMCVVASASAGPKFVAAEWFTTQDFKMHYRIGAAYYTEWDTEHEEVDDMVGLYLQTPVVEWDKVWISFGTVVFFENFERTRPEFSLCTSVGKWVDCPQWLNWEIGPYIAVSPYGGHGVLIGLVDVSF
jgi:hypothetical protein